ncbi:MAG TPA: DNA polymerase I [Gammaproteobacteria bacterium]|nr:DNA polymerase I [Gammaproteobacteria bacterium]
MTAKPTLALVDGSSYLYRAFHALPALTTSTGQPTGAIHGVIAMLRRLIKDHAPACMAVVFDARGPTFRDDLYPAYKANRAPMPDELGAQVEPLHAIIRALGLPLISVEGVEADDVIGTLATQAHAAGMKTLIATGDKDMAQLVTDDIVLVNTMDNSTLDPAGVQTKFGVAPAQMIDYLTLIGDSSDNVPGVPKVGPKTAVKWLADYVTLDNLTAHAAEIGGKVGENLRASLGQLPLSRQLLTIKRDVPLPFEPRDLTPAPPDTQTLREWYTKLEFKTWLNELLGGGSPASSPALEASPSAIAAPPPSAPVKYDCVLTREDFARWLERLRQAELFAFDTETTSLDYMQARVVGVSFAVEPDQAAYVPLAHDYAGVPDQIDREWALAQLRPLLEDTGRPKLGQHLKYDRNVLSHHGILLAGIRHDSMLESYVLDSTATRHDLDSLALKYLGHRTIHFEDVAGKGANQITFNQVPVEQAAPYAAEDADVSLKLHRHLWPRLEAEPALRRLYEEIEIPLIPVLSRMELTGVAIDTAMLARQGAELAQRMREVEEAAYKAAGQPFNLGSPKQIQQILFEKLNIPPLEKTPGGQPSTAESVLAELAQEHKLPGLILEHRSLSKLKSTYTDTLPLQVSPATGRVHTSYHQAVAATGRLSSSDPNLQNIPIRTEEGRRIRQAFVAPAGHVLLAADYSQIELRIMAHLSGDRGLIEAFARGEDIHRATAAEVFGLPPAQVSDDQRRAAKAINFGLIYGMSAFGLARQLGIERGAAQQYVDLYFTRYPGVKAYMERTREQARERGFVETLFGRRLYLPDIRSRNNPRRQYAERTAINAPMQGSAADIIKRAMISVDRWLTQSRIPARMIMQVHDELVLEVAAGAAAEVAGKLRELMSGAASLSIPLVVDVGTGANWDEAH